MSDNSDQLAIPPDIMAKILYGRNIMSVDITKHPQYKDWLTASFKVQLRKWFL